MTEFDSLKKQKDDIVARCDDNLDRIAAAIVEQLTGLENVTGVTAQVERKPSIRIVTSVVDFDFESVKHIYEKEVEIFEQYAGYDIFFDLHIEDAR